LQMKTGTTRFSLQYGTAPRRPYERVTVLAGDVGLRSRGVWGREDTLPGETGQQGEDGLLG
jgi:hypothetical protein